MADPNTFDPNAPYEAAQPATATAGFDPNQPYEAASATQNVAQQNIDQYPVQEKQEENHWVGKMVPQWATSAMKSITDSYPVRKSEELAAKGAEFGRKAGADWLAGASGGASGYSPAPRMQPLTTEQTRAQHPIATGVAEGVGGLVGGVVGDPRQLALTVATLGASEVAPLLSKVASGGFGAQMGTQTLEGTNQLVNNWDRLTPEQRAEQITNLGLSAYFSKEALQHSGAPQAINEHVVQPAMDATVRGASKTYNKVLPYAKVAAPLATAAGVGTQLYHGNPMGAMETAIGGGYLANKINKMKPAGPNLTERGLPKPEPTPAPAPEAPAAPAPQAEAQPQTPQDKALNTLKTAYDKANSAYQKAHEAREAYRASMDQGVQPPAAVQKAFEKAEKALDEAQYHYEAAQGQPQPQAPAAEETPLEPPKFVRGGQQELPGGGTMGKPLQLKSATEAPEQPARMVSPVEEQPAVERPITKKIDQTNNQISRIRDLTQEGLGGKTLEKGVALRDQIPVPGRTPKVEPVEGEVLPPEKEHVSQEQIALDNTFGEDEGEEKTIEGETEHPRTQVHANGEALANAIPKTPEGHDLLDKLHKLSNVELRQLAINAGEDMGQSQIGRGKSSGNVSRPEVFERMLKNHSAEDLGKMVDEGKHLPPVSGGSQGATATPEMEQPEPEQHVGTKEGAIQDTDLFHRARIALGEKASISEVAQLAQVMKEELYKGPERRGTDRRRPANAQELEEAINSRKPSSVQTPFDVTEGAKATMERDRQMPKEPTQDAYQQIADNHNKYQGFTYNPKEGFVRDRNVFSVAGEHPDLERLIKGRKLTSEDVKSYMEDPKVKEALKDPNTSVGGWNYKGNVHLELSKLFHDKDEAISEGKRLNQNSIYDHATRESIETGGTAADEAADRPNVSYKNAKLSDEELQNKGWTPTQLDAGDHLPTVGGGNLTKTEAKALADRHLPEDEEAGIKSDVGRNNLIKNLMRMPAVREVTDIAKAGESGRKWYQRSAAAFDALSEAAPHYFQDGDRQKFTDFLAALSPQQSVKMNLQEALSTWSKYVDMGRPEGKELKKMLSKELTLSGAKVPNAMRALAGEDMWPDLSNNRNFKVPSFSKNLKGFMDKVTNDGWQAAFAGIKPSEIQTATGYHPLAVVTRAAAEELGWEPAEAQAAIWAFTKTLTEEGNKAPEKIRQYSEDFADLMAHDQDIRRQLTDLGIDTGALDERLRQIDRKPEVTTGASPTAEDSIRKLAKRIEKQRGKLPQPKDSGLFDKTDADERENFFKSPENDEATSFNPDELYERVAPEATDETRKMSKQELLDHGFSQEDIDAGKHLPSVSGGSQESDEDKQPIWHSKAEKIAEEKLGGKGSGDQILATLKNNGVKADELEHLGMEDFLKGKDKVSKQEVLDHIKKNQIQLKETTKGEGPDPEKEKAYQEAKEKYKASEARRDTAYGVLEDVKKEVGDLFTKEDGYRGGFGWYALLDSPHDTQVRMLDRIRPTAEKPAAATQPNLFADMAERLPKGAKKPVIGEDEAQPWSQENYDKLTELLQEHKEVEREYEAIAKEHNRLPEPKRKSGDDPKFESWTLEGPKKNYKEKLIQLPEKEGERPFVKTSHFDEPNVVAHTRYDDRVDADGKKNLFIEEVQSDWHQTGREEGYGKEGMVPNAPFKNDWHELVMKRMLREAADKGYDRISWTTGDQQADRYNLAKQVSKVEYNPETKEFNAYNGYRPVANKKLEPQELKDYIGNELAQKLLDKTKEKSKESEWTTEYSPEDQTYNVLRDGKVINNFHSSLSAKNYIETAKRGSAEELPSLEGLDLKVGGAWAKALYDRAIPNFLNKYLKKFNVKVEQRELETRPKKSTGEPVGYGEQDDEGKYHHIQNPKVHSIDITPEMRKELKKSQPIAENENEKSPYEAV